LTNSPSDMDKTTSNYCAAIADPLFELTTGRYAFKCHD
jgi:hypothetical protein